MRQHVLLGVIIGLGVLVLLLTFLVLGQAHWAVHVARASMRSHSGVAATNRASVQVVPARGGWLVIFHDAQATCDQGTWWPDACRDGARVVYRDVYACVLRDGWLIDQIGASPRRIAAGDLCTDPGPRRPGVAPSVAPPQPG